MPIFRYDHSFDGYLTAVFQAYAQKRDQVNDPVYIVKARRAVDDLFAPTIEVDTEVALSDRVTTKLKMIIGKSGVGKLWRAWLSELPDADQVIWQVIKYVIESRRDILTDFTNPHVLRLSKILKMVRRERHRMTAFVRFKQDNNGLFFATIEPDFNVLPLIKHHFENRYADQPWLIFDTRRDYGISYDLKKVVVVERVETDGERELLPTQLLTLDTNEAQYQRLWKGYFHHTDIKGRRNMKLHLRHVPRRYWKYLVEK